MKRRILNRMVYRVCVLLCMTGLINLSLVAGIGQAAEASNQLITVEMDDQAVVPTVLIQTQEPVGYRYTVYDSFDPARVVIDFPGMEIGDIPEIIPVNGGAIKELKIANFDLTSGNLARVEIHLEDNIEYQVNLEDTDFRVAFTEGAMVAEQPSMEPAADGAEVAPEPAMTEAVIALEPADPAERAEILRQVVISPERALLDADGKIEKFKYFTLGNPPRLVVDIFGVRPAFKQRSFSANQGIKQVRVGTYNTKTRFVFDASGDTLPEHVVEQTPTGVQVAWGDAVDEPMESAQPAAAATEPAPAARPTPEPMAASEAKMQTPPAPESKPAKPAQIETLEFLNEDGRSLVAVTFDGPAEVTAPVQDGNLVRFQIRNARLSPGLRRTIDTSAFPTAVTKVTPYVVSEGGSESVRIAVDLKEPVPYQLEKSDTGVALVIDDGAYAQPASPAETQVALPAPKPEMSKPETAQPPAAVSDPDVSLRTAEEMTAEAQRYTGEKISLVFDNADIRSILQLIGDVSGLNILAGDDVGGTITIRLIDVPWDQALDLILETKNLKKIQDGNVLRIMTMDKWRGIKLAEMNAQKKDVEEGALLTRVFQVSYSGVEDMKTFLEDLKSERGSIISDSRNKQLIVKDVETVLEQMEEMIGRVDKPERQVLIEARIVEATTTFARDLGVKWNFDFANDSTGGVTELDTAQMGLGGSFVVPVTNPAGAGFGSSFAFGGLDDSINIDLRLSALETSGEGRIVSTPRVTTLNGEAATISQGTKIPFSTVSDAGTDVTFENAELSLQVTPEINPDGSVILEINASNSSVGSTVPTATGNAVSIEERKAETKVLVRDGQTTVIGGIYVESETDGASGVPLLKDIPIMGHLFKSTTRSRERRELLIFITPRIIES